MFEQIVGVGCLIIALIMFVAINVIEYVQHRRMTAFK